MTKLQWLYRYFKGGSLRGVIVKNVYHLTWVGVLKALATFPSLPPTVKSANEEGKEGIARLNSVGPVRAITQGKNTALTWKR